MGLIKENDKYRKLVNIDQWHRYGITGKHVTIAILDGDGKPRNHMRNNYIDVLGTETKHGHATNVGNVILEMLPDCRVLMFDNLRNKDNVYNWIKEHKDEIDLINVSLAGLNGMTTPDYLRYEELGIPMVCGAGNDYFLDRISYPARYPFTIAIGAYNYNFDGVAPYSNQGKMLDALCPSGIYVKRDDGKVFSVNGTSFSSPVGVAMLGALVDWRKMNNLPKLSKKEAKEFVHNNTIDLYDEGFDTKSGYGLFVLPSVNDLKKYLDEYNKPKEEPPIEIPNDDNKKDNENDNNTDNEDSKPNQPSVKIEMFINSKTAFKNDKQTELLIAPKLIENRTMLGIRDIANLFNCHIAWDGAYRKVTVAKDEDILEFYVDKQQAYVNGNSVGLTIKPTIVQNRVMIGVRDISNLLNLNIHWTQSEQKVTIIN